MKKQFKIAALAIGVMVVTLIGSCELFSPYAKLYGTWNDTYPETWIFNTDNTWSDFFMSSGNAIKYTGTYTGGPGTITLKGKKIYLNGDDVTAYNQSLVDDEDGVWAWSVAGTSLTLISPGGYSTTFERE